MTAEKVVNKYIEAIGGKEKVMAVKTMMTVSTGKVQGIDLTLTQKHASLNKLSVIVNGMGQTLSKQIFDGSKGYREIQGKKKDFDQKELEEAKSSSYPFADEAYKKGALDRIEPVDGKNYFVIKHNSMEIFYDAETGLKSKEIRKVKSPEGEVKVPTTYSDYKEVNGIKFPHKMSSKMGRMDIVFNLIDIKVNEGVTDEDFK
jgi:hypothetical protein